MIARFRRTHKPSHSNGTEVQLLGCSKHVSFLTEDTLIVDITRDKVNPQTLFRGGRLAVTVLGLHRFWFRNWWNDVGVRVRFGLWRQRRNHVRFSTRNQLWIRLWLG